MWKYKIIEVDGIIRSAINYLKRPKLPDVGLIGIAMKEIKQELTGLAMYMVVWAALFAIVWAVIF